MAVFNTYLAVTDQKFVPNLIYLVEGWLMGGSWYNLTSDQLLFGWQSEIAAKATGGDFWQGADNSIQAWMTPIIND